jgi:hypothetical protein
VGGWERTMTEQEIQALRDEIAKLKTANAGLAQTQRVAGKLTPKVSLPRAPGTASPTDKGSEGGAVSVYGLARFPVTLYKEQWLRLLSPAFVAEMLAFIKANEDKLSSK